MRWSVLQDDGWCELDPKDRALIEHEYVHRGPNGSFTTAFSFSSVVYRVDLALMEQVNTDTNNRRGIRRDPVAGGAAATPVAPTPPPQTEAVGSLSATQQHAFCDAVKSKDVRLD